jgi:hypothetical protein
MQILAVDICWGMMPKNGCNNAPGSKRGSGEGHGEGDGRGGQMDDHSDEWFLGKGKEARGLGIRARVRVCGIGLKRGSG